jgi:hypothetical protein
MMKKIFWFIWLLPISSVAQTSEETEQMIASLHGQLANSASEKFSDSLSKSMREIFIRSFEQDETFEYPFEKLKFCTLTSSDNRIRLFNWNQPYPDGRHKYYCFVLLKDKKDQGYIWIELKDNQQDQEKIENKFLTPEKWLGALYYEIIPMDKKGRGDTYTLLGWDGKDNLTTRKIIDALTITGKKIRFGASIFAAEDNVRKRYILEYSNDVSASVKFYSKKSCIVMDHLSPKNPLMTGVFADYGPDGTYHLFMKKNGKWEYIDNIDITEFAEGNDKPFYDPRPSRRIKKKE